jgi:hypothetical protein
VTESPAPAAAPQCLTHEDCGTPHACNAVTAAEFAAHGYSDFDHWETT